MAAGGSVPSDPEMAADPHICSLSDKFDRMVEVWKQKHLPLSWGAEINAFIKAFPSHCYTVNLLRTYD